MFLDRADPRYSDDERSQRRHQAERLLADPFFQSVMEEAETTAIREWLTNTSPEARERCWLLTKGLDAVLLTLRQIVGEAPK